MKDKKSFIAYCDWGEIFDELEDNEAGKLVKHLFNYVRDKNPNAEDKLTKMMFIQIKQSLKRDLIKYDIYISKQSENGKKGGRPKKPTKTQKTQPFIEKPKKADTVTDSVTVNVNVNENDTINDIYSKEVYDCFEKCLLCFEEHLHPDTESKKNNWLDTIDKLERLDEVPLDVILEITKKTREDSFWSKNFLSLTKLRKTNDDGIKYIVVFNENLKNKGQSYIEVLKSSHDQVKQGLDKIYGDDQHN